MYTTSTRLLERLREPGQDQAWQRFVQLYTPLLYTWAHWQGLQGADAADLVQDVFTLLLRKLPEFRYDKDRSFRGWLRTLTLNKWRENQRRKLPLTLLGTGRELDEQLRQRRDKPVRGGRVSSLPDGARPGDPPERVSPGDLAGVLGNQRRRPADPGSGPGARPHRGRRARGPVSRHLQAADRARRDVGLKLPGERIMPAVSACIPRALLRELIDGHGSTDEVEQVALHLEGCARCGVAAEALLSAENLSSTVPAPLAALPQPDQERLDSLMERIAELSTAPDCRVADVETTRVLGERANGGGMPGHLGPYRLVRLLGQGGMGMVFLADDTQLHRTVAIKIMRLDRAGDSAAERFLREARTMACLKHDNVVTIYHVGDEGGVPYLVMEYLQGESLGDRLREPNELPVAEILRIGREVALGLHCAHEQGLIHRDVKPDNVWLEAPHGRVKLLDFGLARANDDNVRLTQRGVIVGTPMYLSPEQAQPGARRPLGSVRAGLPALPHEHGPGTLSRHQHDGSAYLPRRRPPD